MTKTYQPIETTHLTETNTFSHVETEYQLLHLEDPAFEAMIDLTKNTPTICQASDTIDEVLDNMKSCGLHIMLVVDNQSVVGVISSEDILGEKPMQIIQERRIRHDQVLVKAVMTTPKHLLTIREEHMKFSKIGHLLATLSDSKHHYALVVEYDDVDQEKQVVIGLVYYYNIIRRLDKDLATELRSAGSLLELQKRMS